MYAYSSHETEFASWQKNRLQLFDTPSPLYALLTLKISMRKTIYQALVSIARTSFMDDPVSVQLIKKGNLCTTVR